MELRVRGDRESRLAQCAVRGEALLLRREYVPAATAIVAVAVSMPAGGRERDDAGVLTLLRSWCGASEASARTCGKCRRGSGEVPPETAAAEWMTRGRRRELCGR